MQLKEAYQRLKKQQESSPIRKRGSLDHNSTIGSIHTGHVNFSKDQTFFSNFKIRDEVKIAKQYVNNLKDADLMQLKDKSWNISVLAPRKFEDYQKEETHKSKLLKIKLGFSDFSPIKQRPNKIYPGTESRDNYQGWNVSTYFEQKQKKQGLQAANVNALQNTLKSTNQKLPVTYKTLKQRYSDANKLNKSTIASNTQILQDIKQSYLFTHPNASPERTNASTIRIFNDLQRQKIKQQWKEENEGSTQDSFNRSFKANLSPTQKQKIRRVYFHTGKWEKNQNSNENKADQSDAEGSDGHSWSCCRNQSKQSQGCSYRVQDGNKMNMASYST